jgi:hypothetical protein
MALTWSADVSSSESVVFTAQFFQGTTPLVSYQETSAVSLATNNPTRLWLTTPVPPSNVDRVELRVSIVAGQTEVNSWVGVSRVMVGNRDFFDGNSIDVGNRSYSWSGATNASESIETRSFTQSGKSQVGEVISWRATEGVSPTDIGSSVGTFGTSTLTAKTGDETRFITDNTMRITHESLGGEIVGIAGDVSIDSTLVQYQSSSITDARDEMSGVVSFGVSAAASLLNVDRTVVPVNGQALSTIFQDYVNSVTETISVTYTATLDPTRTYRGWEGNVWQMLLALCAANNVEMVVSGTIVTVRDIGGSIFQIEDNESVQLDLTNNVQGRSIKIRYYNYGSVSSGQTSTNFSQNPSLETNAVGWSTTVSGFGSVTAGRVTN